ncbi:MAG TPA: hypothetical protein VME66_07730 [Candidatus Acidoferrales bacterium]|nr:hypothetical protein [Candidatus Acidoferrales bacterium]
MKALGTTPQTPGTELNSEIQLLRARVESELRKPAVVMVTSACQGDGKSLTAYALAGCFASSGHRAALVTTTHDGAPANVAIVALPQDDDPIVSREQLAAFVSSMRSKYDYTVVDAGTFMNDTAAMALTRMVDGILLTVCVGRAPTNEDDRMIRMIDQFNGRVVGVVATDTQAIDEFERSRSNERITLREWQVRNGAAQRPARTMLTSALSFSALLLMFVMPWQNVRQEVALNHLPAQAPVQVALVNEAPQASFASLERKQSALQETIVVQPAAPAARVNPIVAQLQVQLAQVNAQLRALAHASAADPSVFSLKAQQNALQQSIAQQTTPASATMNGNDTSATTSQTTPSSVAKPLSTNLALAELQTQLARVNTQLRDARGRYPSSHPVVISLQEQQTELQRAIAEQGTTVALNPMPNLSVP